MATTNMSGIKVQIRSWSSIFPECLNYVLQSSYQVLVLLSVTHDLTLLTSYEAYPSFAQSGGTANQLVAGIKFKTKPIWSSNLPDSFNCSKTISSRIFKFGVLYDLIVPSAIGGYFHWLSSSTLVFIGVFGYSLCSQRH